MERTNWLRKRFKTDQPSEVGWNWAGSVDPSGRVGSGLNDFPFTAAWHSQPACLRTDMPGVAIPPKCEESIVCTFALTLSPEKDVHPPSCKCASAPMGSSPTSPR